MSMAAEIDSAIMTVKLEYLVGRSLVQDFG
jgi:hypothetical protein